MPRRMEPSDICQIVGTLCVIYHIFCKEEEANYIGKFVIFFLQLLLGHSRV